MKLIPKSIPNEHLTGIKCVNCEKDIYGLRYTCKQCKNFHVCSKCIPYIALHHNKAHSFHMMNKPPFKKELYMNSNKDLNCELSCVGESSYKYEYKKAPSNQQINIKVKNNGKMKFKLNTLLKVLEGNSPVVSIPQMNPGEEISVSLSIFELDKLEIGHYTREIRLNDEQGIFGNPLYINIEIK